MIEYYLEDGADYQEPNRIIVHAMGEYICDPDPIHATKFLEKLNLSAHFLIAPDGNVWNCRSPNEGAWHARGHNKNSIGIEFLVKGEHTYKTFLETIKSPYLTDKQLKSGVHLCKRLMDEYNIRTIERHSDVSPGRKVDPGNGFPWDYFLTLLGE